MSEKKRKLNPVVFDFLDESFKFNLVKYSKLYQNMLGLSVTDYSLRTSFRKEFQRVVKENDNMGAYLDYFLKKFSQHPEEKVKKAFIRELDEFAKTKSVTIDYTQKDTEEIINKMKTNNVDLIVNSLCFLTDKIDISKNISVREIRIPGGEQRILKKDIYIEIFFTKILSKNTKSLRIGTLYEFTQEQADLFGEKLISFPNLKEIYCDSVNGNECFNQFLNHLVSRPNIERINLNSKGFKVEENIEKLKLFKDLKKIETSVFVSDANEVNPNVGGSYTNLIGSIRLSASYTRDKDVIPFDMKNYTGLTSLDASFIKLNLKNIPTTLEYLDFYYGKCSFQNWKEIIEKSKGIKTIRADLAESSGDPTEFFSEIKNSEHLELIQFKAGGLENKLPLISSKSITSVSFEVNKVINVDQIIKNFPNLKGLSIDLGWSLKKGSLNIPKCDNKITTFSFKSVELSAEDINNLSTYKNLEMLILYNTPGSPENFALLCNAIAGWKNLRKIDISSLEFSEELSEEEKIKMWNNLAESLKDKELLEIIVLPRQLTEPQSIEKICVQCKDYPILSILIIKSLMTGEEGPDEKICELLTKYKENMKNLVKMEYEFEGSFIEGFDWDECVNTEIAKDRPKLKEFFVTYGTAINYAVGH